MKRLLAMLISSVLLVSCGEYEPEENKVDIKEELKISAYLLGEEFEGNGYWAYSEDRKQYPNFGYWVSDDGREYDDDEVFALEELEVGEVRTLAPLGYNSTHNITLWIECDDIIEFTSEQAEDYTVQVSYSLKDPDEPLLTNWTTADNFRMRGPAAVSICPIGKFTQSDRVVTQVTLTGKEYDFTVRTYSEDNSLIITAKLRLTVLEDEAYPNGEDAFRLSIFSPNEVLSRFLSIELVSYEYSDIYKLDESMYEEE